MPKRPFTAAERVAVFTAHGERCYLCGKPVDLLSMEVDHILPEQLLDAPSDRLHDVLTQFGLPHAFDFQSYENWLPACGPCNNQKRSRIFDVVPIVSIQLKKAREKAPEAERIAERVTSGQSVGRAINTLQRAFNEGSLSKQARSKLNEILRDAETVASFLSDFRQQELEKTPLFLAPGLQVIAEGPGALLIHGPYGVGARPAGQNVDRSFDCPTCGPTAWSGAQCVRCGHKYDD